MVALIGLLQALAAVPAPSPVRAQAGHYADASTGTAWSLAEVNRWYVGVKFGSYAGPIALLGLAVLAAATWD